MPVAKITKYAIRKPGTNEYLSRSGTRNEWFTNIFVATQFHRDPFIFPEIRKIIDSGEGEIVTVRITAEII